MRKILHLMLLLGITMFTSQAFAQEKTVTGKVLGDNSQPLVGATVKVRGSSRAVVTNASGFFSIKVNKGETLEVSHVGYELSSHKVGDSNEISVSLKTSDNTL